MEAKYPNPGLLAAASLLCGLRQMRKVFQPLSLPLWQPRDSNEAHTNPERLGARARGEGRGARGFHILLVVETYGQQSAMLFKLEMLLPFATAVPTVAQQRVARAHNGVRVPRGMAG